MPDADDTPRPSGNEIIRLRRLAALAYSFLNIGECPRCHLPRAVGYICPCGYDGDPNYPDDLLVAKIDAEFR